ncbi:hypothetical protein DSO57_1017452 [Entomophthora muscae]|uniref:Uncharacterized protein n=1 Tax=Entomophthora muscae TaxID=34485 RepID=A0ACC2RJ37_9FUNG|nr:hypothetical protein DSO57_1017452 [Entomophthora muscae]
MPPERNRPKKLITHSCQPAAGAPPGYCYLALPVVEEERFRCVTLNLCGQAAAIATRNSSTGEYIEMLQQRAEENISYVPFKDRQRE